jgi:hypothetical protein
VRNVWPYSHHDGLQQAKLRRQEEHDAIDNRVVTVLENAPKVLTVNDIVDELSGRYQAKVVKSSLHRLIRGKRAQTGKMDNGRIFYLISTT